MANFEGVKWTSSTTPVVVTWSFADSTFSSSQLPSGYKTPDSTIASQYRGIIEQAFAAWAAVANITFVEKADAANNNIRIGNYAIDGFASGGGSSVLAETFYWGAGSSLKTAEIVFDADAYVGTKLFSIAEHEIGHALGLDHASLTSSVMYAYLNGQNQSGVLTSDDIGGIQTLYGAPVTSAPTVPVVPTLTTLQTAFTYIVRVSPTASAALAATITLADGTRVTNPLAAEASGLATLAAQVDGGLKTVAQALTAIGHYADDTTSVATMNYQFFTGKTPTAAGLDYLVHSASNANDLGDAYYAKFSLENRYINFAVNLGKLGEGAQAFAASYGGLTLSQAVKMAYQQVFGVAATDAKVADILGASVTVAGHAATRADYFAAYGLDGANGIGTKAAAVGYLLAEAVKGDTGALALANDHFLADLADGTAQYNVNLAQTYTNAVQSETELVGQTLIGHDSFIGLG
ncbi:MAG: matrixin family metalloprotease [Caulobacteraceae bacterium]